MDVFYGFLCFVGIIIVFVVVTRYLGRSASKSSPSTPSTPPTPSEDLLPNGYTRADYHHAGVPDSAIDLWGLDQPNAPGPHSAGFAIGDMADGKFDGKFDL
jgi:hypothetical protein